MKGSPVVVTALQATLAMEAQINAQYRVDAQSLAFMGFGKIAKKVDEFRDATYTSQEDVTKRLLFSGAQPKFTLGEVSERSTVTDLFKNALSAETDFVKLLEQNFASAAKEFDSGSASLFQGLALRHSAHVAWLEQQVTLIAGVGGEAAYLAQQF